MSKRKSEKKWQKAWQTVGKFLHGFAVVESNINEVFVRLYNLEQSSAFVTLVMTGRLRLQEKLELIDLGLKQHVRRKEDDEKYVADRKKYKKGMSDHQKIRSSWKEIEKSTKRLRDVRNVIAHAPFDPVNDSDPQQDGIDFDYVSPKGEGRLLGREKKEDLFEDLTITYAQFDEYEQQTKELLIALREFSPSIEPISDFTPELTKDIAEIIASSGNVIPFPKKP